MKKLLLILLTLPFLTLAQYGKKTEKSQFKTIEITCCRVSTTRPPSARSKTSVVSGS